MDQQESIKTYDTYGLKIQLSGAGIDEFKRALKSKSTTAQLRPEIMKGLYHSSSFFPILTLLESKSWVDWMKLPRINEVRNLGRTLKMAKFDPLRMFITDESEVRFYANTWTETIANIHKACEYPIVPYLSSIPIVTCKSPESAKICWEILVEVKLPIIALAQSTVIINSTTLDQKVL